MDFQVIAKKLEMNAIIDMSVPDMINSDEKRYKQVLFNLIQNAVNFTFEGSVSVFVHFDNNNLVTEITDTGIGMDSYELEKIFKFFGKRNTSDNSECGGIGLGLTISKKIVENLNGTIEVQS